MTNYQSTCIAVPNEVEPLVGDTAPPVLHEERPSSYKRYIIGPLIGLCVLGVGLNCSRYFGAADPSSQDVESFIGNLGNLCNPKSEKDYCGPDKACCPMSGDYKSLTGAIGTCQTCCSDITCVHRIEQPPAGSFGARICVDQDKCEEYADGHQSSTIPAEGFPVYVPSETIDNSKTYRKYVIPRKVLNTDSPGKPVMESSWYFDFNEQDESFNKDSIVSNGTHITIPSNQKMHAGYSKKYLPFSEEESGIVTLIMADNVYSVVADYPMLVFVEKYHALTFQGEKDEARGQYVKKVSAQQVEEKPKFDLTSWLVHGYATTWAVLRRYSISSQVAAGVDFALNWQIRRYVDSFPEEDVNTLTPTSPGWSSHSAKAQNAIKLAKDNTFEREHFKSEQHCKHLELGRGPVTVSYTDDTVTFPLGRPITIFSGEMVNAPSHYLGLGVGTLTAHYNENKGVFQLFLQGFSISRQYADAAFPGPPGFAGLYVSPVAEGSDYVVDPEKDGRSDALVLNKAPADHVTKALRSDVPDLTLWRRPLAERCEQKTVDDTFWENIDITKNHNSIFDSIGQSKITAKGIVRGMACSTSWMKADYGEGTHGFDANEIGIWAHSLGEIRDDHTKEMTLAPWWDEWECFYQDKDLTSCH